MATGELVPHQSQFDWRNLPKILFKNFKLKLNGRKTFQWLHNIRRIDNYDENDKQQIEQIELQELNFKSLVCSREQSKCKQTISAQGSSKLACKISEPNFGCQSEASWSELQSAAPINSNVDYFCHLDRMESEQGRLLRYLASKLEATKRLQRENPVRLMISYCRSEALEYALQFKKALVSMSSEQKSIEYDSRRAIIEHDGDDYAQVRLQIYLDVHEIKLGCDWADSLNEAVRSCHLFVCLVTPSYGKTLWTSRELKLADQLNKFILPINFCTGKKSTDAAAASWAWPPESLAIQLATRQFISWRASHSSKSFEFAKRRCWLSGEWLWPEWAWQDVQVVASKVYERAKVFAAEQYAQLESVHGNCPGEEKGATCEHVGVFSLAEYSIINGNVDLDGRVNCLERVVIRDGSFRFACKIPLKPRQLAALASNSSLDTFRKNHCDNNNGKNKNNLWAWTSGKSKKGKEKTKTKSKCEPVVLSPTELILHQQCKSSPLLFALRGSARSDDKSGQEEPLSSQQS